MRLVARQLQKEYPDSNREFDAALAPLRDLIVGEVRPILVVMLSGAYVLLLISCVNVTMLLLARSDIRRREIAVRGALGAPRPRLFCQFAAEGLVLAVAAGAFGLVCAEWGMRLLVSIVPEDKVETMPWIRGLELDPRMVAFSVGISLAAGAIFGVIPFFRTSLPDLTDGLRAGARGASGTMWRRFGSNLLVVQMALATILLVNSGLLGKSLYFLLHVDTGMRPDHLASVQVDWPDGRYSADEQVVALERRTLREVSALPGVKSVAASLTHPVGSDWGTANFHIVGRPNHGEHNEVLNRQVSPAYFTTLQARLIRGRYFGDTEDSGKPHVAIVNRTLARKYFGGEDPVGKRIYYDWAPRVPEGSLESANGSALYVPFDQNPDTMFTILVRTSTDEKAVLPEIANAIHRIDRDLSVHDGLTMTERIGVSAPLVGVGSGKFRRHCICAGHCGSLRSCGLFRQPANPRDRGPNGARGGARFGISTNLPRSCSPGWRRNCARGYRLAGSRHTYARTAFWRAPPGRVHVSDSYHGARRGGASGMLHSRSACRFGRPGRSTAFRIGRALPRCRKVQQGPIATRRPRLSWISALAGQRA